MVESTTGRPALAPDVCARALDARDARFDGIFFVGIVTTGIYCRPVCPARVSNPDHRRFFATAAEAERAGFRPCLRCRPELAPGRALTHAVSRLAYAATQRIAAGALNGRTVAELARELCVSERHLRRALEREVGVSPVELAQTHRLLLAKRLMTDTDLPVWRVAYASGFQSLRRFNAAFRERYRMSPNALRRSARPGQPRDRRPTSASSVKTSPTTDMLRLTLSYRLPFAWDSLLPLLGGELTPGVEVVDRGRYGRTVRMDGSAGVVFAEDAAATTSSSGGRGREATHLNIHVSSSLLPVLMPLITRLRHLFDLDAEPTVIDTCLEAAGLGPCIRRRPGVRVPGAFDGFEIAFRTLLRTSSTRTASRRLVRRAVRALGDPIGTGVPGLTHLAPAAESVAAAGTAKLAALGVPPRQAAAIVTIANAVAEGSVKLDPGNDVVWTWRWLRESVGVSEREAMAIVTYALRWPDAFQASDRVLQQAAGVPTARELRDHAAKWRPWRAYATIHLRLHHEERSRDRHSPLSLRAPLGASA